MNDIKPENDIIDSRDVIERIEDLTDQAEYGPLDQDDSEELAFWREVAEQGEGAADWIYGATLIADSYFTTYAQELADDIGAVNSEIGWPACHIDWDAAATALKIDYFEIDVTHADGCTYSYWIR